MISHDLVSILKKYVDKENNYDDLSVDFLELFHLSKRQGVAGIVYDAIGEKIDNKELKNKWQLSYFATMQKGMIFENEFNEIIKKINENNLKVVTYKGAIIKHLYPNPYLRLMGDIDFGFDIKDADLVIKFMEELGYQVEKDYYNHRNFSKKPYVNIEFHGSLHEDELAINDEYYDNFLDESVNFSDTVLTLNPTMHFMYLITHLYQHMIDGGIGIRSYLDLYLFINNYQNQIDYVVVENEFRKMGLYKFYDVAIKFINMAFKGQNELSTTLYEEYLEHIFSGGIYGEMDRARVDERKMAAKGKSKFSYVMARLFPKYSTMKEKYPVLKKPLMFLLAPIFYIYRIFSLLFKRKKLKKSIEFISSNNDEKIRKFSTEIGLITKERNVKND